MKENLTVIKLFCAIVAQAIIDAYKGKGKIKQETIAFFKSAEYEEIASYLDKIIRKPHFKNIKKLVLERPEIAYQHRIVSVIETDRLNAPLVKQGKKLYYTTETKVAQKALKIA